MNNKIQKGEVLNLAPSGGATVNNPVMVGNLKGVAAVTIASGSLGAVDTEGVFDLSVKAVNDAGNVAVAIGDQIYFNDNDTPKLTKKRSGKFFGYALEAITSGSTATINVLLCCGEAPKFEIVAAGTFTTAGGDANETITIAESLTSDIAIVTLKAKGATPRTILTGAAAAGQIDVVLSGDPSTDHVLAYQLLRAKA